MYPSGAPGFRLESTQVQLPPSGRGRAQRQGKGVGGFKKGRFISTHYLLKLCRYIQIKKGELVLAEQPAVVVQDGGDLTASELFLKMLKVKLTLSMV